MWLKYFTQTILILLLYNFIHFLFYFHPKKSKVQHYADFWFESDFNEQIAKAIFEKKGSKLDKVKHEELESIIYAEKWIDDEFLVISFEFCVKEYKFFLF